MHSQHLSHRLYLVRFCGVLGLSLAAATTQAQSSLAPPKLKANVPPATFTPLGDLDGGSFLSRARGVSPDGSTVVGESISTDGQEGFVWTAKDGMIGLGDLPGGDTNSTAHAVASYGTVIVGHGTSDSDTEAFQWTLQGGLERLGALAGGPDFSAAIDVSAGGDKIVGYAEGTLGLEAVLWTGPGQTTPLGDLPGGIFASRALSISADGSTIVGDSVDAIGSLGCQWIGEQAPTGTRRRATTIDNDHRHVCLRRWNQYRRFRPRRTPASSISLAQQHPHWLRLGSLSNSVRPGSVGSRRPLCGDGF